MVQVTVLIGIPGSGKSTVAKALASQDKGKTVIVSRDAIRLHMFGVVFDPSIEDEVTKVHNSLVLDALRSGKNVVVDNTNLRGKYRNDIKKLIVEAGVTAGYGEIFINTDVETCKTRNLMRPVGYGQVPPDAMDKFIELAKPWYSGKAKPDSCLIVPPNQAVNNRAVVDPTKLKAIVCDLDGTLADMNGRDPYDASTCDQDLVVPSVLACIEAMHAQGYNIIFVSGRDSKYRFPTEMFLRKHIAFPYVLLMRSQGDTRKDDLIKKEIYHEAIEPFYNVAFVLDDRPRVVRMWRYQLGITVFQLNDREF